MSEIGEEWRTADGGLSGATDGDAAAIARAHQQITKHRQRPTTLRLIDRAGQPVANRQVQIVQTRSAFLVGEQTWELDRMFRFGQWNTDRARAWRQRFAELFNAVTCLCYWTEAPRNDGAKAEDQQGFQRLEGFHACGDWGLSAGLAVKGHPLFWSIDKCVPDWVKRYDVATQMKFAEVRVRNLVASCRGSVQLWDAVNEALWEAAPKNLPDRHWPHLESIATIADYISPVLRWCREENPDATFLINDYGLEGDFRKGPPIARDGTAATAALQRRRMLELVRELQDRGTPPDGIGLQAHTAGWLSPAEQIAVYDELAEAGLPLHITEFWPPGFDGPEGDKTARQDYDHRVAEYVADYLTLAFGHPAIDAFFFWGLIGHAVHFKGDNQSGHELRPVYHKVRQLLREQWMTRATLKSNDAGVVNFQGFAGEYTLRYQVGDQTYGVAFALHPGECVLRLLHA